jgi:hypothetical protein
MNDEHSLEKKRMSLLEKLASSFSRRDDERAEPIEEMQRAEPDYARRPAGRAQLDPGSRPARARDEQDDLEIPAFLRRQA